MLQQDRPDDYVIGTGESHTVEDFARESFAYVGLDWRDFVEIDPRYFRPTEVDHLCADTGRARKKLNWWPKVSFSELVKIMMDADLRAVGIVPPGQGEKILETKDLNWIQGRDRAGSADTEGSSTQWSADVTSS